MGRLPEAGRETPCFFCCFLGYPEHNPHLARSYPWGHLASPTRWEAAVFYYREQVPTETAPRDVVLTWQISDRCPGSSILPPGPPWGRGGWRTGLPPLPAWFPTEPVVLLYPLCLSCPCDPERSGGLRWRRVWRSGSHVLRGAGPLLWPVSPAPGPLTPGPTGVWGVAAPTYPFGRCLFPPLDIPRPLVGLGACMNWFGGSPA